MFCQRCGQVIDLEVFTCFLLKLCFWKISFSLQKEEYFEKPKNNEIKVAKSLTYGGHDIDPTAYMCAYIYMAVTSVGGQVWVKSP